MNKYPNDPITRADVLEVLQWWEEEYPELKEYIKGMSDDIDHLPPVHADKVSELVRCKDCKWYREGVHLSPSKFCYRFIDNSGKRIGYNFADNDFCSYAERRTDG